MHNAVDLSAQTLDLNDDGRETRHACFEIHELLAKATYRGQSPLREDALTIIGHGSTTENQHATMDVIAMKGNGDTLNE